MTPSILVQETEQQGVYDIYNQDSYSISHIGWFRKRDTEFVFSASGPDDLSIDTLRGLAIILEGFTKNNGPYR